MYRGFHEDVPDVLEGAASEDYQTLSSFFLHRFIPFGVTLRVPEPFHHCSGVKAGHP